MTEILINQLATELTPTQRRYARNIIAVFVEKVTATLEENVIEVCKNLDNAGIPKQLISQLVCQESKDKFGVSEQYLRRLIPTEYKNQKQREIRLHYGETKVLPAQTVEVNKKEDLELIQPSNANFIANSHSKKSQDKEFLKLEDSGNDLKGLDLNKLPEEFKPYIVNLIRENKSLKTSNSRFREQNKDLKFEDEFKQKVIDTLTKQNKEFRKNFADNYESKYSQFKARIDEVEEKNASFNYMLVGLAGISEPGILDEMRLDTVNNFIKTHYDRIVEQAEKHKQEEALIQAQNLESWK